MALAAVFCLIVSLIHEASDSDEGTMYTCRTKLTKLRFDWILSMLREKKIQDALYRLCCDDRNFQKQESDCQKVVFGWSKEAVERLGRETIQLSILKVK